MSSMLYPGNSPSNVSKDAKYSVKRGSTGDFEITLVYRLDARERALLATDEHEELVELVNAVKVEHTGQPGGAFYINEYDDVLVPGLDRKGCYFAGEYHTKLEFDFEGDTISPKAPDGLKPGDLWPGPHVGIDYTLKAGGGEITYKWSPGPQRTREEFLSDHVGETAATALAQRLAEHKGRQGGRIYINEACEFFAPVDKGGNYEYTYLGHLDEDDWFPEPDVPRGRD